MIAIEHETAVGVFDDRVHAEKAVEELRGAGFWNDQIGIAVRSDDIKTPLVAGDDAETTAGGATAGALTGGAFGAVLGALVSGLLPGVGWIIAGGILTGIVGGAAVGAAAGGLLGALIGMGLSEEEARYYEQQLQAGRTVVTVRADGRSAEAAKILGRNGGFDMAGPDYYPMPPIF